MSVEKEVGGSEILLPIILYESYYIHMHAIYERKIGVISEMYSFEQA